ncbi:hypothetical protein UO65_5811 [Actinokineospora spheciospongiae]|uniref:Uncharacterized protein n=1 Tax=Actinokineospora spheciospongiae TaxID=909613 RepID=W7IEC2_9PSEU|nr:hypothetical protein UO65_5811 [Actinokineospora spheciospongiae]
MESTVDPLWRTRLASLVASAQPCWAEWVFDTCEWPNGSSR